VRHRLFYCGADFAPTLTCLKEIAPSFVGFSVHPNGNVAVFGRPFMTTKNNKTLACLALTTALAAALPAAAQTAAEGNWMVRLRATNLDMKNTSDAGTGTLTPATLPSNSVKASDKTIPELDISYFFTPNWAAELVLTYPQKHTVQISQGPLAQQIGSFKQLPPTLLAQYHFNPTGQFRPYIGAGVNYTQISKVNLYSGIAGTALQLDSSSVGPAYQVGMDVKLDGGYFLNFDLKKIYIDSDIKIAGNKVSHLNLDPLAASIGIGRRF
jgi:outer membrane protein